MFAIRTAIAAAVLSSCAAGQGWLDTARWYVPPQPGELRYLADFNADGFDDVVRFNGVPASPTDWTGFRVLFNDGLGDFTTPGPLVSFPVSPDVFRPVSSAVTPLVALQMLLRDDWVYRSSSLVAARQPWR